jgi:hypothetical protein
VTPGAFDRRELFRVGGIGLCGALLAACTSTSSSSTSTAAATTAQVPVSTVGGGTVSVPATVVSDVLAGFDAFAATVHVAREGNLWVVESNGMPTHSMMTGITSWQQQYPVPQPYTGANAFRFPATPRLAATPVSARHALFNGAIALAVDGVPIFNALNNRGDDAYLAGELDNWGGHSGRADDYHYHAAPLYLQELVGPGKPIAYALDGFAIYGDTEPDGSPMLALDDLNGHTGGDGVYHYHGTKAFPYMIGNMVGKVTEDATMQIIPQAAAKSIRPAGTPLKGAVITGCTPNAAKTGYTLSYTLSNQNYSVEYSWTPSGVFTFNFNAPSGTTKSTYNGTSVCKITTSSKDIASKNLKVQVYPNPTSKVISVSLPDELKDTDIQSFVIYNLKGELIYKTSHFTPSLDLSPFAKGIYLLQIQCKEGLISKKIIVQ